MYLLALAQKRQGKVKDARATLRRIPQPDAADLAQMGLLSLRDRFYSQAELELAMAWELAPDRYDVCHNLLLSRLSLENVQGAAVLLEKAELLAADNDSRHLYQTLREIAVRLIGGGKGGTAGSPTMTSAESERVMAFLLSVGHLETVMGFLQTWARMQQGSFDIAIALREVELLKAKNLLDRCDWLGARELAEKLTEAKEVSVPILATIYNFLGSCACLSQDAKEGVGHFKKALELSGADASIAQNLALAHEWLGQHSEAEPYWDRFFDKVRRDLPERSEYVDRLVFEGYGRLATGNTEKERWATALAYAQRAQKLRPEDPETLERLFHLYTQAGKPDDARNTLRQLKELRPAEPHLDLYEVDLLDGRSIEGIDKMLAHIESVLKRHAGDVRVDVRAQLMMANVITLLERVYNQLSEQFVKVQNQVRHLPNYQIDWAAVHELTRDLRGDFQRLRRAGNKCSGIAKDDEQRRVVRQLIGKAERRMDQCRALRG